MVSARTSLGAMERTYQGVQNLRTVLGRMTTLRALVCPSVKWSEWVKTGKSPFRCLMSSTPPSHILHRQSGGHHHSLGDMLGLLMVLILAAYRSPGRRNLIYSPIKVGKSGVHVGKQGLCNSLKVPGGLNLGGCLFQAFRPSPLVTWDGWVQIKPQLRCWLTDRAGKDEGKRNSLGPATGPLGSDRL